MFTDESPGRRAGVGRILGWATLVVVGLLLLLLIATGQVEWKLVTLAGFLWAAWGLISGLFHELIEPAGRFLADQLTGNVSLPPGIDPADTIEQQTARLERLLERALSTPHHEMLIGIRLAEIYRTNQKNMAKSDAVLARLRAKYPDAPELAHAGPV